MLVPRMMIVMTYTAMNGAAVDPAFAETTQMDMKQQKSEMMPRATHCARLASDPRNIFRFWTKLEKSLFTGTPISRPGVKPLERMGMLPQGRGVVDLFGGGGFRMGLWVNEEAGSLSEGKTVMISEL